MSWYIKVLKKYAVFSGRARRKEYWMFVLFNILFAILAMILDNILGTTVEDLGYGYIYILYGLAVILPTLAVGIRRLHDLGKSGWWLFISLIPLVGSIWLIVLMATAGQTGENQYGPDPKAIAS
jgi:uncharacterized membrane protein YhaH (DUF805 family)